MTSGMTIERLTEIRALDIAEVVSVSGASTIDVSRMPDRSVMCGTMWLLLQRGKILTGTQH